VANKFLLLLLQWTGKETALYMQVLGEPFCCYRPCYGHGWTNRWST